MPLPAHLFASDDGALYDTRDPDWSRKAPLRANYRRHFGRGAPVTLADVKAALRAGPYAWPGGYQLFFITRDGAALSFAAVREQFRNVCWDFLEDASTGWRIDGLDINYEDADLRCDHTGELIPAAYADPDADEQEEA
jgi:hypothetical protein